MTENQKFQDLFNDKQINNSFNNRDFFEYYRIRFGKTKGLYRSEYSNIVSDFFKAISIELLKPNYRIRMPFNTGEIYLLKNRCKVIKNKDGIDRLFYPIDWKETKKIWDEDPVAKEKKILIRFTNEHTGGYVYRAKYRRPKRLDSGISLMDFEPCRDIKRKLAKYLKETNGYLNCDIKESFKCK